MSSLNPTPAVALLGRCSACRHEVAALLRRGTGGRWRVQDGPCPHCGEHVRVTTRRNPLVPWYGWLVVGAGIGVLASAIFFRPFKAVRTGMVAGYRDYRTRPPGRPPGSKTRSDAEKLAHAEAALRAEGQGAQQNPTAPPALMRKLAQEFEGFHGVQPKRVRFIKLPDFPRGAWLLGRAESISYVPPRYSQRSDGGRGVELVHGFGDYGGHRTRERPLLLASADGRQLIIYKGNRSRFRTTGRGIVG